jgi:hypothetical protein
MSSFHQFDPGQCILSIGQTPTPISGYAKGTFIDIERDANAFEKFVGSDGEVTRIRNRNRSGMVKITLQQGSQTNALLSALAQLDEASGTGAVPLTFMDMSGQTPQSLAASTLAWVRKMPALTFAGDSEETREWILDCASMEIFVGGN